MAHATVLLVEPTAPVVPIELYRALVDGLHPFLAPRIRERAAFEYGKERADHVVCLAVQDVIEDWVFALYRAARVVRNVPLVHETMLPRDERALEWFERGRLLSIADSEVCQMAMSAWRASLGGWHLPPEALILLLRFLRGL